MYFPQTCDAWHSPALKSVLTAELRQQGLEALQKQLQNSSVALADKLEIMLLKQSEQAKHLEIKLGIFYQGVITGCNCADDPMDFSANEYCELLLTIEKHSQQGVFCAI